MKAISRKRKWVRTDSWRGYQEPVNAVCGANDTGMFSDSPCPTDVCSKELAMAGSILRKNKIPYISQVCPSSNVFCVHRYLVVHEENVSRAKELVEKLVDETRLLYIA